MPLPSHVPEEAISPLPVQEVGRSGRLQIRFSTRGGRTVLGHLYQEVPFKVTGAHYSPMSSLARVIVMHSTAGLFGGDRLEARIHVASGARALVTSQSATKIHPSGLAPAYQSLHIEVETGGELHYYTDPIIPFADSRLRQNIRIELGPGARFYYWDGLMAGRVRRGESWRFAELSSETSVFVDSELAFLDRFELRPQDRSPMQRWTMHDHTYMATAIAYDPNLNEQTIETIRSGFGTADESFAYGLDLPSDQLMIGRYLAKNGSRFRKARDNYEQAVSKCCEPT